MDIAAEASFGPGPIEGGMRGPRRKRFAEVEPRNPGLNRNEAALLASMKPGTDTLIVLLKDLHKVLPRRPSRRLMMVP